MPLVLRYRRPPFLKKRRALDEVTNPHGQYECIEGEVDHHHHGGKPNDAARKPLAKDGPKAITENRQQNRDGHLLVPDVDSPSPGRTWRPVCQRAIHAAPRRKSGLPPREGIVNQVLGGVGGRQRPRYHEVGGGKAEHDQDDQLARPAVEAAFQQSRGPLAVRRAPGDVEIERQGAEQRRRDNEEGCKGGCAPSYFEGNRRLVGQGAEIVEPHETEAAAIR